MGIPRFFSWLTRQEYPEVLQEELPGSIDWLIFDMNSLFHQAHQVAYAYGEGFNVARAKRIRELSTEEVEKEFRETLINLVMGIVVFVSPKEGILLAVDGVAPQAKIQQQRQRRYKGPRTQHEDEKCESPGCPDPELIELRKTIVDPNRITPGTDFMFRLDDFLVRWIKDPKNRLQLGVKKVIYSSHLVPGEGEHKYLEFLRSGDIPNTGIHAIHGMDADLFILSLIAPVERIFITREDIAQVVNIQNLRYNLTRQMRFETTPTDFTLLTFLLGNDFFPHQPSLLDMGRGINAFISAYLETNKPLTERRGEGYRIIWSNFLIFLRVMAKSEGILLANEAIRGFKYPSIPFQQALHAEQTQKKYTSPGEQSRALRTQQATVTNYTFYYETFRQEWYHQALGPRGDTSILEFLVGRPVYSITPERIKEMCLAYLRGLTWNLTYYTDGWDRASLEYVYPFHHVPLFSDLVTTLENLQEDKNLLEENVFR
ncbi:MAG: XRN family 5'-3' exonuclease, partial [Solirubrobacteraceae bacterium]